MTVTGNPREIGASAVHRPGSEPRRGAARIAIPTAELAPADRAYAGCVGTGSELS